MREPLQLGGRGQTLHTAGGKAVAFAPDVDLSGFPDWLAVRHVLAAAPELADTLEDIEKAVVRGDLHGLKNLFKSQRMRDLLARIRKAV